MPGAAAGACESMFRGRIERWGPRSGSPRWPPEAGPRKARKWYRGCSSQVAHVSKNEFIFIPMASRFRVFGFAMRRDAPWDVMLVGALSRKTPMTAVQTHPENRLARESSPYLLQHKFNPVDWWPWGPEALAQAKRSHKPILLSVGYAACHWCHVMAHESFEDEAVARVMNELFVNIKVDREERPDVDQIYMSALHMLGEQGGWPLTMFLTPAGEPFWGGTYFPKTARYGRPAFVDVLREVARLFREEPLRIEHNRQALMERLSERARPQGQVVIARSDLDTLAQRIAAIIDPIHGGLKGAPKFPQAAMFELLWRAGQRTGETRYFGLVELTLERICNGGIYDHLGGGFSRYSVDADSEGEEGKFYVWSLAEIEQALGPQDAAFFAGHYDVTAEGNFEGHNILNRLEDRQPSEPGAEARLAELRAGLLAVRDRRVRPGLDDKILADWNGLMIAALVNAGISFDEPGWIAMAARAFAFIAETMARGDRLGHSWRDGKLIFPGLASDFAAMIRAALALHEATADRGYLDRTLAWQRALDRHHDDAAGYFLTADDAEGLVVRPAPTQDEATPNPNALAAQNLIRLAVLAGDESWRAAADRLFVGLLPQAFANLVAHAALLIAVDFRLRAAEIVVTGENAEALFAAALELPFLDRIVLRAPSVDALTPSHPARAKLAAHAGAAAFVCVGERCSLPVTEPQQLAEAVAAMRA